MTILDILRRPAARLRRALRSRNAARKAVFDGIYQDNAWGDDESASGSGSNMEQTRVLRRELPALLARWKIRRIVDAPCGDYHWMSQTPLELDSYVGVDLVPAIVRRNEERHGSARVAFRQGDIVRDALPECDALFCRDCLVHLSFHDALAALRNMRASGARYLLTTTFTRESGNVDIPNGQWRTLNLRQEPFSFPKPLELLIEECTEWDGQYADKALGLWRFADLPL